MMRCGMLGCILTTMLLRRRQLEETRFERIAGAWNLQRLCAQPACILRPQGARRVIQDPRRRRTILGAGERCMMAA
ncbi:hypothetical protein C8F01DRAFT_1186929, partial [Mycena amicta]